MPAKPLTPEQVADARRLKSLFAEWQAARRDWALPASQETAAELLGFNQSATSQYLSGRIPLNVEAAVKFAKLLERPVADFSPTIAAQLSQFQAAASPKRGSVTTPPKKGVSAIHPDDELPDDVVLVPESRIEFSAGNGRVPQYELVEDEEPATYRLSWFQKYGMKPDRVRRFRVHGDSMEPLLYARDTILVNLDETNIVDGRLYAIRYGDELRVKYLSRRLDGTIVLRSVNPLYKDEEVPPQMAAEHITVIGRVRDRSGTGGL